MSFFVENRTMTAQSVRDVNIYHRPVIVIGRGGAPPDAPMDTAVLRTLQFLPLLCFPSRIQLVSLYPVPAIPSTNRFSCFLSKLNGTEPILELIMRLRNMDTATSKQDAPFPRINVCTIFQHVSLIVRQTLRTTHTGVPNDKNSKHFFAFGKSLIALYPNKTSCSLCDAFFRKPVCRFLSCTWRNDHPAYCRRTAYEHYNLDFKGQSIFFNTVRLT